uniref:Uncharacterized protein n=1 Tax=Micrurus spixii TaxID=129469 RepID=A0A2D4LPW9_9SAUR
MLIKPWSPAPQKTEQAPPTQAEHSQRPSKASLKNHNFKLFNSRPSKNQRLPPTSSLFSRAGLQVPSSLAWRRQTKRAYAGQRRAKQATTAFGNRRNQDKRPKFWDTWKHLPAGQTAILSKYGVGLDWMTSRVPSSSGYYSVIQKL